MTSLATFNIAPYRIALSRCIVGVLILLLLFTDPIWQSTGGFQFLMRASGYLLLTIAVFGRVWSGLYISGRKNRELVTVGPYSIVRNPLYLFSLIGGLGIGLGSGSILITLLIIGAFYLIYPTTVGQEEAELQQIFGEEFTKYCQSTSVIIPNFKNYQAPEEYLLKTKKFHQALLDAIWFLWGFGFLQAVPLIHAKGWLPSLFQLP